MKNKDLYLNEHGVLKNKLGIEKNATLLDLQEASISFNFLINNIDLFRNIDPFQKESLSKIHKLLFQDIYEWAGEFRKVNISKENTKFLDVSRFQFAMSYIFDIKPSTYIEIIDKYNEINIMHPFREGNGRTGRIWLNLALEKILNKHVEFSQISKKEYLKHMKNDDFKKLSILFEKALVNLNNKTYKALWIHNAEISYQYEGYHIDTSKVNVIDTDKKNISYDEYLKERKKAK